MNQAHALYVGINVSKTALDLDAYPQSTTARVTNDETGRARLVVAVLALQPCLIVVEATDGLESAGVGELAAAGLTVAVINPRQARDFARALGILARPLKWMR